MAFFSSWCLGLSYEVRGVNCTRGKGLYVPVKPPFLGLGVETICVAPCECAQQESPWFSMEMAGA